ncbi:hypothetical protein ACUN90_19285, partial [Escherichia sp. SP-MK2]
MKLNFKGFFKAAGLFPLALMLSGCISYALVSHTAKGSSGKYQSQSDTISDKVIQRFPYKNIAFCSITIFC